MFRGPVSSRIISEIKKRSQSVKDCNGQLYDIHNSPFGFGPVPDTIPTVKKDLDDCRKAMDSIISTLKFPENYLEQEPVKKKMSYTKTPKIPTPTTTVTVPTVPFIIKKWHKECKRNLENGSIGLVPECYQSGIPPMDTFLSTNTGLVVQHILNFTRNKIFK
jgi:hypothetical protein